MHECGLTIRDLVQSGYRQMSSIKCEDVLSTSKNDTTEKFIQRVKE